MQSRQQFEHFSHEAYVQHIRDALASKCANIYQILFSPCGEYALCCDSIGYVTVWIIKTYLSAAHWRDRRKDTSATKPDLRWRVDTLSVYTISFIQNGSKTLLLCGGDNGCWAYDFAAVKDACKATTGLKKKMEPLFHWVVGQHGTHLAGRLPFEINDIVGTNDGASFLVACGDSNAYEVDMSSQQVRNTYSGHRRYLHRVRALSNQRLATASEDGSVRLWDCRSSETTHILRGVTAAKASDGGARQPNDTDYVSCLDVDESSNWLVCGGGGRYLSLWHLPSLTVTATLPSRAAPRDVMFFENSIISACADGDVQHWHKDGSLHLRVQTRGVQAGTAGLFTVAVNARQEYRVLTVAGAPDQLDVYLPPFNNLAFSLNCV